MEDTKKDLSGMQFGRWTVLGKDDDKDMYWICQCSCEKRTIKSVYKSSLILGKSKSCGCIQKETVSSMNKKYNHYDLSGEYGIGWTTNTNKEFYFDLEDYDKIKNYCWTESVRGYVSAGMPSNHRKRKYLHRIITDCDDCNIFVDHIDHDPFNNKKNNLRLCTPSQNSYNKGMQPYNTSGEIGVFYHEKRKKWIAQITCNGKHYCKYCDTKEKAIEARSQLEEQYFDEYGYRRSINIAKNVNKECLEVEINRDAI